MRVKFFYLIAHDSMSRKETEKNIETFLADPHVLDPKITYTALYAGTTVLVSIEFTRIPHRTPPPVH